MYHVGRIIRKTLASPSVMVLDLNVPGLTSFLPGQWVDFVVPPHQWIGGFSIASSPRELPKLTLAIKKSNHSAATWVHEKSQVDQEVHVQVGGTCVLPPLDTTILSPSPRIFCAGGIGISPILSQYREFLSQRAILTSSKAPGPATRLFYSVSQQSELIFGDELARLVKQAKETHGEDQMIFSLTQAKHWDPAAESTFGDAVELKVGRAMKEFLNNVPQDSIFYLCGPPGMLDEMVEHLVQSRNVQPSNIHYEKWW